MPSFNAPRPQAREETPEEKAAWLAIREHINELALVEEQKFDLPGRIISITGAEDGGFIWKKIKDRTSGALVDTPHLKITAKLDDPKYAALKFVKDMKVSFFDGVLRGQGAKSPFRGMFYYIHRAATGREPSPGIVNGSEPFDTDEYVNVPMRVVFLYQGRVAQGEEYFGTRANLKVWLDHFEPTPDTVRANRPAEDDGYGSPDPSPFREPEAPAMRIVDAPIDLAAKPKRGKKETPVAAEAAPADPGKSLVTDRQVSFIFAIAREAGKSEAEVEEVSAELFGESVRLLSRRDASSFIDYWQRERQNAPADTEDQLLLPV